MTFDQINSKMIEATVRPGQTLYCLRGAMLAYRGEVSFTPTTTGAQGVGGMIGRRLAGESVPLMKAEGDGTVMFGHAGRHVHLIQITGDTLHVEADRLLVFEDSLQQGTMFMGSHGGVRGMIRGQVTGQGLFTTTLTGHGWCGVLAHGGVIELPVQPGRSIHVDPQAYVAHRGQIDNRIGANVGWRDVIGRGSGEAFQLELSGTGTVYVQASEEKL
ncbi:AIM24 family protein [Embleya sp. NPDC008237]|uniref:AIM24 family protein n=1 Tax=Embleya sp. NPDC008237 TaxID=3363978 RepID=UPI0036E3CFDF